MIYVLTRTEKQGRDILKIFDSIGYYQDIFNIYLSLDPYKVYDNIIFDMADISIYLDDKFK